MFSNTAEIINLRPQNDTKNMELFKAIHRSQHVQRNFDLSKRIPEQDISTIITAATQCPSKQNVAHYKIHAVTNREIIEEIYECTTCSPDSEESASGHKHARSFYPEKRDNSNYPQNPQVLGNLVLVFEEYENFNSKPNDNPQTFVAEIEQVRPLLENKATWEHASENKKKRALAALKVLKRAGINIHDKDALDEYVASNRKILATDRDTALGIAIGYVNLTAAQLGYGTGCCSCIMDRSRLKKLLGLKRNPMIVMGIGFKQEGVNRRVHHKNNSYTFNTRKKQPIEISYEHY